MNVDDWYTLTTEDEVITGQISAVNPSYFKIKQGDRTRAFGVQHIVALNPVNEAGKRPETHRMPI